jgi:hypothetical protein
MSYTLATDLAPRDRIETLFYRWETGVIDKYEFYGETLKHRPSLIAEITGIDRAVIDDRRAYLRQLGETVL